MSSRTQAGVPNPLACPICQKRFTAKESKERHVVVVHENSGRFKCGHCGKTFYNRNDREAHERVHTGERPFGCRICQMRFNTKTVLRSHHLNVHSEKKFKCQNCDQGFGQERALRQHLVVHSTEKPFQCELCPGRFPSKIRLQIHHRHCHAEKKFTCETCGKGFSKEFFLRHHLQSHSNERFECDLCGKSYQRKHGLKEHQKRIHSATQPEASGQPSLARGEDQEGHGMEVVQPNSSDGSVRATYNLRPKGDTPNYRDDPEDVESEEKSQSRSTSSSESPESDFQDNDDEPTEPDAATGEDVVLEEEQDGDKEKTFMCMTCFKLFERESTLEEHLKSY